MDMINKEQLLYFFLQGKVRLSQYDYKFMANLQTMIQNKNRVTSNQSTLFDNLISKYNKQLIKHGLDGQTLKTLPWKTMVVESTSEYTGANVYMANDDILIRVPFNKTFISAFRSIHNNPFEWDRENKLYRSKFSTSALKITTELSNYFNTVKFDNELENILMDLDKYKAPVYNPTAVLINGNIVILAVNEVLATLLAEKELILDAKSLFELSTLGITIDPSVYQNNDILIFASKRVVEVEITNIENVISYMKDIGCDNVIIGRGLRNIVNQDGLADLITKYGMNPVGPMNFGSLPEGVSILLQHTSNTNVNSAYSGKLSKIVVLKDSRPVEVK